MDIDPDDQADTDQTAGQKAGGGPDRTAASRLIRRLVPWATNLGRRLVGAERLRQGLVRAALAAESAWVPALRSRHGHFTRG